MRRAVLIYYYGIYIMEWLNFEQKNQFFKAGEQ